MKLANDKIVCFPGVAIRIFADRSGCHVLAPGIGMDTKTNRKSGAKLIWGIRKSLRDHANRDL